jgi:cbb3-type cytochrome oxidase subunit 1
MVLVVHYTSEKEEMFMGAKWFKIAAVYFSIGIILGIVMGIIHDFALTPVHAHINLLGWASMALFGAIYHFYPQAAETSLAKTHFWLHNLGVPIMQGGLAYSIITENESATIVIIVASIAVVLGGLLFTINLFRQV